MVRKDLYVKILRDLAGRLNLVANVTDEINTDFNNSLTHYRFEEAIDILKGTFRNCQYSSVFDIIKVVSDRDPDKLEDDISTIGKVFILPITDDLQKVHLKSFVFTKTDLVVLPAKTLFEENGNAVNFLNRQEIFVALEHIYNNAVDNLIPFIWDHVDAFMPNDVFIVCSETSPDNEFLWRKYAFACLCHVENSKFDIPLGLQHTLNSFYSPAAIQWNPDITYEQFFDVYNVLNEVKHSGDYLTIYLKIYQTLEYFVYRLKLVAITKGTPSTRQSFIRRIMSITENFRKYEENEFCDGFKKMFPAPVAPEVDVLLLKPTINSFIEKYYKVKYSSNNDINKYAKVVYQLRNSIVHNKEAELHFSYGNMDEYSVVIPLIAQLIKTLGRGVVHIINNPPNQDLVFDKRELNLY